MSPPDRIGIAAARDGSDGGRAAREHDFHDPSSPAFPAVEAAAAALSAPPTAAPRRRTFTAGRTRFEASV